MAAGNAQLGHQKVSESIASAAAVIASASSAPAAFKSSSAASAARSVAWLRRSRFGYDDKSGERWLARCSSHTHLTLRPPAPRWTPIRGSPAACLWDNWLIRCLVMNQLLSAIAAVGVLLAGSASAADNLNTDLEEMCKPLLELNPEFGASAAPGSPIAGQMQKELSISSAQYGALWSLLKLTPTPRCSRIY